MTRRVDDKARSALLDRIVDYAFANGVGSLSLRPLAHELGISAASLLYHFGSKEELTVEILKVAGERQRELFGQLRMRDDASSGDVCRAVWSIIGTPESRTLFRLFFEIYGLALVAPERFPGFFPAAIENWLGFLSAPYLRDGMNVDEARANATILLATFRGLLLDLCASGDQARVDRAFELWVSAWE